MLPRKKHHPQQQSAEDESQALFKKVSSVIGIRQSLHTLQALLALDNEPAQEEEYKQTKESLEKALELQVELAGDDIHKLNGYPVFAEHIGRVCRTFDEEEGKWLQGQITDVNQIEQLVTVRVYKLKSEVKTHSAYVKVSRLPQTELLHRGDQVDCLWSGDGEYHRCVVEEEADGSGLWTVKYDRWNTIQKVKAAFLRLPKDKEFLSSKQLKGDVFVCPQKLRAEPGDSKDQRLKKKKSAKALKFKFSQRKEEESMSSKQSKWLDFKSGRQ